MQKSFAGCVLAWHTAAASTALAACVHCLRQQGVQGRIGVFEVSKIGCQMQAVKEARDDVTKVPGVEEGVVVICIKKCKRAGNLVTASLPF